MDLMGHAMHVQIKAHQTSRISKNAGGEKGTEKGVCYCVSMAVQALLSVNAQ